MVGKRKKTCAKCGKTSMEDPAITFHRFPLPSTHGSLKARVWAKYCYPNDDWSSDQSLHKLYALEKYLCGIHFDVSSFTSSERTRLNKFAIPCETVNILAQVRDEVTNQQLNVPPQTTTLALLDQPVTDGFNDVTENFHDSVDLECKTNSTQLNDETLIELCSVPDTQSNAENEESDTLKTNTFSWQQPSEVVPIPADDIEIDDVPDNLSMYCDDEEQQDTSAKGDPMVHEEFRCNVCGTEISGFRYTCVQCSDFDLCSACETNREHRQHYMLRVPTPRPAAEVRFVLATIRRHLMKRIDTTGDQDLDDAVSVKSEVKSENEDDDDDDQKRSSGDESDSSDTTTTPEQSDDEEVECSTMGSVESDDESRAVDRVTRVVSTECTERTEETPTEIRYGEEAIQQQPAPHTTHKRKILIDNMQLLAMLNDCTTVQLESPSGNTTDHNVDNR